MDKKTFFSVAGAIFLLVALVHLWRIIQGWAVFVGGYAFPVWASWVAVVVGLFLAFQGLKHRRS